MMPSLTPLFAHAACKRGRNQLSTAPAGSEPSEKESTLSCAGPGLESLAVRDWSTDEAYSERLSGDGGRLLSRAHLLSIPFADSPAILAQPNGYHIRAALLC